MLDGDDLSRQLAFDAGCIVAYDVKDGMEISSFGHECDDSYDLIHDDEVFKFVSRSLFERYSSYENEDDEPLYRPLRETLSEDELSSAFNEFMMNLVFFRLNKNIPVDNIEVIRSILSENCFFPPEYVFIKGQIVDDF
ncbi:hypothetical protein IOU90_004193 [Salmonella enterica]|uniref:hypothetical protein n=1 Tax=Salmonella enterica TaxID=28901 RepID=UPI0012764E6F|nr:hypothetical protein [Salmonella enterica]EDR6016224.1 hypothetical protein [Salmonella enterica subsp. enterica serovar Javiana]ECP0066878.1 hypothetical protein [Salmonella enterica]EGL0000293.1 hypothetical protein [Salmonella enterica]EHL6417714.1 hypothetical protein [Salmonella enterica]